MSEVGPAKSPGLRQGSSPPVLSETDDRKTSYVIAIGVDNYLQPDLQLDNCKKDCTDLIEALQSNYKNFEIYQTLYNEAATKQGILTAIRSFCEDTSKNNVANNLVLFYSGHGSRIEPPNAPVRGSWLPYDFDGKRWTQLELSEIMKELEFLETLHLMVIADCCYAGGMFQTGSPFFEADKKGIVAAEIGLEPSRWGIASSRSSELSGAGQPGSNSIFTAALVQLLSKNNHPRPSFNELAQSLRRLFANNPDQRVEYQKLNVSDSNTGEYILEAKEEAVNNRKRYQYLENSIKTLNYDDQRAQFLSFEDITQNIHFTFISGTPACGLYFLSRLARESNSIGAHTRFLINTQLINGTSDKWEDRLMLLFRLITRDPNKVASLDAINAFLIEQLKASNVVIEIRFYNTVAPAMDITPQRKQVIGDLAAFAQSINQQLKGRNRLYIFIVDLENADYETLVPENKLSGVEAMILKKVSNLSKLKFRSWYDTTQLLSPRNAAGISEFKQLFDELLYKRLPVIFEEKEDQAPAHIIKQMCILSDCSGLVEELLNQ